MWRDVGRCGEMWGKMRARARRPQRDGPTVAPLYEPGGLTVVGPAPQILVERQEGCRTRAQALLDFSGRVATKQTLAQDDRRAIGVARLRRGREGLGWTPSTSGP